MNPQNQGISSSSPADPPLKRRRGRPRKDEGLVQAENVPGMPGSDNAKKSKQTVGTTAAVGSDMMGQMVYGVIDGVFDAGYLLKVKVGDSDTYLRGVVFLPGRFTPITATNDVAPQAKMYRRAEMPIPVPNLPAQAPGSVPLSEQHDKQPIDLKNLAPTVQVQRVPAEIHCNVPVAQDNQSASSTLPLKDNLPMSGTGPSLGGKVMQQQIFESGLEGQPASVMSLIGHDKAAEHDVLMQEFEASVSKVPNVEATVQAKSVPKSTPSVNSLPGTDAINLELQIQHQVASHNLKPNQSVHNGVKSPNLEGNQTSATVEPGTMPSEPIGTNIWMEKQASSELAAPPALAMKIIGGDNPSHVNGSQVSHATNVTEADSQPASITSLPVALFERESIPFTPKLVTEGSSLEQTIKPQFCSSSGAIHIMKADSETASMASLPVTLFERQAIPSECKLATNEPVLPRMSELQFCGSSGAANTLDCNVKEAVPPAES